jgi:dihydrofolate synthase/folylpolyglutamate synthase
VNFSDARAYVESLDILGMRFGLARMRHVLAALGDPHRSQPAIHVVGTNGKSSTTRLLAALLAAEGLRTAAYLSPHIVGWTERVMIDGAVIGDDVFAAAIGRVRDAVDVLGYRGDDAVTQFEVLTAAAFVAVARAGVDVLVLEAGLGGRYDATNVVGGGAVTVLTNIAREHAELLGESELEIAREKLAVAPDGSDRLVVGRPPAAGGAAIAEVMAVRDLSGWRLGSEVLGDDAPDGYRLNVAGVVYDRIVIGAAGRFQRDNLAVAVAAAQRFLGRGLDPDAVRDVAARVRVPGRLEVIAGSPTVVLDGAHNPAGMVALADSLEDVFPGAPPVALVSVLDDKDAESMLRALVPRIAMVVATRSQHPRAVSAESLAALAARLGAHTEVVADPEAALEAARRRAGPEGGVLVCGSLYLLADLRPGLAGEGE